MAKFKVGDKVRVVNRHPRNSTGYTSLDGEICEISILDNWRHVSWNDTNGHEIKINGDYAGVFTDSELELVEKIECGPEPEYIFKKGDRVRSVNDSSCDIEIGGIYEVYQDCTKHSLYILDSEPSRRNRSPEDYVLVESWTTTTEDIYKSEEPIIKKEIKQTTMSKIKTFVKNLTLTSDEKLLRKYGLHDEDGNTTPEGMDAIEEMIYAKAENQEYLLSIAKGLEEEAQKSK